MIFRAPSFIGHRARFFAYCRGLTQKRSMKECTKETNARARQIVAFFRNWIRFLPKCSSGTVRLANVHPMLMKYLISSAQVVAKHIFIKNGRYNVMCWKGIRMRMQMQERSYVICGALWMKVEETPWPRRFLTAPRGTCQQKATPFRSRNNLLRSSMCQVIVIATTVPNTFFNVFKLISNWIISIYYRFDIRLCNTHHFNSPKAQNCLFFHWKIVK